MNRAIAWSCTALLLAALAGASAAQQKPATTAAGAESKGELQVGSRPWKGDFEEMTTKRRVIRVAEALVRDDRVDAKPAPRKR